MADKALIQSVNSYLQLQLPETISFEQLQQELAAFINHLINTNFEKLISLLYRIDISEAKLKELLQHNEDKNAGEIIAALIIERQQQKIKTRQMFSRDDDIAEEDKW
jgi:hypothetical protein